MKLWQEKLAKLRRTMGKMKVKFLRGSSQRTERSEFLIIGLRTIWPILKDFDPHEFITN